MKTSPESTGDLGQLIISELNGRGVALPKPPDPPSLPTTWHTFTLEIRGVKGLAVRALDCSLDKVADFCFLLLSPFRVYRPFSRDNDRSFWFSVDGKEGSFSRTDTGLVVSFITWGVSLTIGESDEGLHMGFTKHPPNPG